MKQFEIRDVSFAYPSSNGRKALDGINLTIEQGEYVVICGRSGSGKTTLLRHLKTALTPVGERSGDVLYEGKPLSEVDLRTQTSRIGYVMQNPDNQIVTDKVWHELAFGLESLGVNQRTMRLRVAEMASYFGIQDWFDRGVTELSGGQKQLLNLASIMAMQPRVLILDEPTSQLDPIAASDFLGTVRKINRELGISIIITEHRLEDVLSASDRVVVMDDGKIIADAEPRKVGSDLKRMGHPMFAAMPSPVQIYYGVKEYVDAAQELPRDAADAVDAASIPATSEDAGGAASSSAESHDAAKSIARNADIPATSCPLTVREGRSELSRICDGFPLIYTSIPSEDEQEVTDPVLLIKEVWYRYDRSDRDVLRDLTFAVQRGSITAVVGGNGTGKSTMLKVICNICKPYRGKVYIDGKPVDTYKAEELLACKVAMLPQNPHCIFTKKTVMEELKCMVRGGLIDGFTKERKTARAHPGELVDAIVKERKTEDVHPGELIDAIVKECEIEHLLDAHPSDLSGGEAGRVAIAKVLLTQPEILLLDEPSKGMDNIYKSRFAGILARLKERGVTTIIVSHDVEFCARYADSVSMFFGGSIITQNSPRRFFAENNFYTTAANRMSRHLFRNAVTNEDVIELCKMNLCQK